MANEIARTKVGTHRDETEARVRALRERYDGLPAGARAALRRLGAADDLLLEGVFWRLVGEAKIPEADRARMAHVVACFDSANHVARAEPFGRWLRRTVFDGVKDADLPTRAVRVRRLLAARDRNELVHQLRRLVRHGFQKTRRGVDWAALGADILWWGDGVRRRWAQDFFAPIRDESASTENSQEISHV